MVLVHDTLSESALQMYEVSLKYLWLSSNRADTILLRTDSHIQTDGQTEGRGKTICLLTLPGIIPLDIAAPNFAGT